MNAQTRISTNIPAGVSTRVLTGMLAAALLSTAPTAQTANRRGDERMTETASDIPIRAVSFNLKFASEQPPNAWSQRKPVMLQWWKETDPDIVGTQEGVYPQIRDLAANLPQYEWIGTGRDGGSKGEFMAVFFKKERFEPIEFNHYWLSDTPEQIGSATWGHSNRRMVTWVRLQDRAAQGSLYAINTHFDHVAENARVLSAKLLVQRAERLQPDLPIVLLGDFNAAAQNSEPYAILTGEGRFRDAHLEAGNPQSGVATFHGWNGPRNGARIDWIMLRGGLQAENARIHIFHIDGQYPSDHFPVSADLRWKP